MNNGRTACHTPLSLTACTPLRGQDSGQENKTTLSKRVTHIFNNDKIEEMFSGEYLRRHLLMCPQMSPPMFPSMRPPMCPPMFPAMCPAMCPPTLG